MIALEAMLEIVKEKKMSHLVLGGVLSKYQYLDKQQRAFFTRLCEGTLERMIELDYIINQVSKTPVKKMKPQIAMILRMSVYQIKYMDSVPTSAACNEAVKLTQKKGFHTLKSFVNGVLRNVVRTIDDIEYPDEKKEPILSLSINYSMPEWIVSLWVESYGISQTKEILNAFLDKKDITIRTNLRKITPQELKANLEQEKIIVKESETLPYAFFVSGIDYFQNLKAFTDGLFYIQDISSMMVAEIADPKSGDYIIDVCAAPGGKSIHLAEKLQETGMVEARDLTEYKVSLIEDNVKRCDLKNIKAVCQDATVLDEESKQKADIVIADLPCSGLGVLGKKVDIRYNMTREATKELAKLQRDILSKVEQYVKADGSLMYSTCTIDKEENEENTKWFLENYPSYQLVYEKQFLPNQDHTDGFYLAKFKKVE